MTTWKTIPSYENYEASNDGEIRNAKTKRIMKKSLINGYYRILIKNKTKLVHRLVAETFLERKDFNIVHHKDNNKLNNSIENLEWTTQSMNVKKAYKDGLIRDRTGINNPHYKNGKWIGKSKKYN